MSLDEPILKTLNDFQKTIDSTNLECLEKYACSAYLPKNSKIDSLEDARWYTCCNKTRAKNKIANKLSETSMIKLPTTASLLQHTLRASIQSRIRYQANEAIISNIDPNGYGWVYDDGKYNAIPTKDSIAPENVVVSCMCKENKCSSLSCTCRSFKFA